MKTRFLLEISIRLVFRERPVAQTFSGITCESSKSKFYDEEVARSVTADAGLNIDTLVLAIVMDDGKPKVDWQRKSNLSGKSTCRFEPWNLMNP